MAVNTAITLDTLLSFVDTLSAEEQEKIGDLSDMSPGGGYSLALDAFHASGEGAKVAKKERATRDYRVILLNETDGTFEDMGTHAGAPGRAPTDPSKMSDLQKIVQSCNVKVRMAAKKGVTLSVVKVAVGED